MTKSCKTDESPAMNQSGPEWKLVEPDHVTEEMVLYWSERFWFTVGNKPEGKAAGQWLKDKDRWLGFSDWPTSMATHYRRLVPPVKPPSE